MDHRSRFGSETVRKVQQSLDEVPPYEATELTKRQAIRALAPQLLALRSKGYGWAAIAAMLSERGVPVSVAALRTYLRRVRVETAGAHPRSPAKRPRDAQNAALTAQGVPALSPPPASNGKLPSASRPLQAATAPATAAPVQPVTTSGKLQQSGPRRSDFAVRSDKEDL